MINFLREITSRGLTIDTVYDVGAWRGDWSRVVRGSVLPDSEFVVFEANPAYKHDLENSGFKNFNVVLSNPGREYVDFYNGTNTGDSYYKETTHVYDNQGTIRLPCTTIDKLVEEHNLPIPNFIKLDTQGSELDILDGAKSIIDKVDLIYTELPFVCYNKGAPGLQDYIEYFKARKFVPMRICEVHHADSILIQMDIMFMKHETKVRLLGPETQIRPFE
jgi:FkbM family methyltransferase